MSEETAERLLAASENMASSQVASNSTCYWADHMITEEKDASLFPFFVYFLVAFGTIRAIKIFTDLKQLGRYKEHTRDKIVSEFFNQKEFEDS